VVADALSRNPTYEAMGKIERNHQMLKEEEKHLVLNQEMRVKIVSFRDKDEDLMEEIKEENKRNEERKELIIEKDGFKRFQGVWKKRSCKGITMIQEKVIKEK